jgi:hypothetical protein
MAIKRDRGPTKRDIEKAREAESAKLGAAVSAFVLEKGGWVEMKWSTGHDSYVLPTSLGPMYVHVIDDWIACRFEDVTRARAVLPHGWTSRLNPHSGKWNWGCGERSTADDLFPRWKAAVESYLPATDFLTKGEFDAWKAAQRAERERPDPEPVADAEANPQTPA